MAHGMSPRTVDRMTTSNRGRPSAALEPHGVRAVADHLEGEGVSFDVIEHPPTERAATEARAAHVPADRMAKTVVVRAPGAWLIAVVPASRRVDLDKLRHLLGIDEHVALATEAEIAEWFPRFDVGAIPPVGPLLAGATVMDEELLGHDEIVCPGGDHRHSIRLSPRDVVRLADARVGDIGRDWASGGPRIRF